MIYDNEHECKEYKIPEIKDVSSKLTKVFYEWNWTREDKGIYECTSCGRQKILFHSVFNNGKAQ